MTDMNQEHSLQRLEKLFWLADAPLFIDERLVERFFDAVVRPKFEHVSTIEETVDETEDKILAALSLEGKAGISLPEWLKPIKLEAAAKGEAKGETRSTSRTGTISQLKPIWNSERQLEELTRHYLIRHRDRIILNDGPLDDPHWGGEDNWYDPSVDLIKKVPRPLAFLDFEPGTKIIPTAAEFEDGNIVLLYERLAEKLTDESGGPIRMYPDSRDKQYHELLGQRKEYWSSYNKHFSSTKAMLVVENAAAEHRRINWIDFRVPLTPEGDTLHLHITPQGSADAGVFGYNFVRRGFSHGVRIVGTLKSGPDMNVLAIYDV